MNLFLVVKQTYFAKNKNAFPFFKNPLTNQPTN